MSTTTTATVASAVGEGLGLPATDGRWAPIMKGRKLVTGWLEVWPVCGGGAFVSVPGTSRFVDWSDDPMALADDTKALGTCTPRRLNA